MVILAHAPSLLPARYTAAANQYPVLRSWHKTCGVNGVLQSIPDTSVVSVAESGDKLLYVV